ncbi:hypothetical protein R6Q57_018420 [Mikania cordata]
MIKMLRRGRRMLWCLIRSAHEKQSRTKSKSDASEIRRTELTTIDEDLEMNEQKVNGPKKHQKLAKTCKKTIKESGWVFSTRFSMNNAYAVFMDRMTSTGSFGGHQTY